MRCPRCQTEALVDSRFCEACGAPLGPMGPSGARRIRIGRGDDMDLLIGFDHGQVSRHHADLLIEPEGALALVDMGSANGTTVDGVPLVPGQPTGLSWASHVRFGSYVLNLADARAVAERADDPVVRPAPAAQPPPAPPAPLDAGSPAAALDLGDLEGPAVGVGVLEPDVPPAPVERPLVVAEAAGAPWVPALVTVAVVLMMLAWWLGR